jgi:cytochrome P450
MTERERIERAVVEYHGWAQQLLARKRAEPGEDLTSELLAVEGLAEVELVNLLLDVILGGIDTAQSQLSHTMRLLAEHPDQWGLLREQPAELAGPAVEEALRYEPVTPFTARITTDDVEYRGVTFPANTVVMISAFHANRDGVSEGFDIAADRERGRPLTFGAGIHYCVGANVARAELQEALAFLAERVERLELDGEPGYGTITGIYGLDRLPLRLHPA